MRFFGWALLATGLAWAQSPSPYRLRADVRYLASDLLEGRAPGTRGDILAAEYLRARFASLGLKTSFQAVPLIGLETQAASRIGNFTWLTDVVGFAGNRQSENTFQFTDVVFAGHGIDAAEFQWDDYRDLVVRGKIVVLIAGEPASDDPAFFGGIGDTAYASAEYKFAEATRRGALATFIIHTPDTSGLSWEAVRERWGTERILPAAPVREIVTQGAAAQTGMLFEGWITKAAAAKWLETDIDALIGEAGKPGFAARRVEKRMAGRVVSNIRSLSTRNLIAIAPGAELSQEAVLFTAHIDHLGIGKGAGDRIYNGAVDNATGLAAMLEAARLWTEVDPAPARTAIFVATGAEEPGGYGAQAYAASPAMPVADTRLAINFHSYLPLGRTRDFVFNAITNSTQWPFIRQTVNSLGLEVKNFPTDASADAAVLTRAGFTAFTLRPGADYSSEPGLKGTQVIEFNALRHRQPADEYREDWDVSGLEQVTRVGLEIGLAVANAPVAAKPQGPPAIAPGN